MAFNWLALELSGPDPPRLVRTHKRVNLDQHDFKEEKAWGVTGFEFHRTSWAIKQIKDLRMQNSVKRGRIYALCNQDATRH